MDQATQIIGLRSLKAPCPDCIDVARGWSAALIEGSWCECWNCHNRLTVEVLNPANGGDDATISLGGKSFPLSSLEVKASTALGVLRIECNAGQQTEDSLRILAAELGASSESGFFTSGKKIDSYVIRRAIPTAWSYPKLGTIVFWG